MPIHRDHKPGHIYQIDPEHDEIFGACLMIATEIHAWGAQGYFDVPGKGRAFYRCKYEDMELVGHVAWEKKEEDDDE
jgi:hypothetical protein